MQTCTRPVNKLLTRKILKCMQMTLSKSSMAKNNRNGRNLVERATYTSNSRHITNERGFFKTISKTHVNQKAVDV